MTVMECNAKCPKDDVSTYERPAMSSPRDSTRFYRSLRSFQSLKNCLYIVLDELPATSSTVASLEERMQVFEADYLLLEEELVLQTKRRLSQAFSAFFSDSCLVSLGLSFSSLISILDSSRELIEPLFRPYLADHADNIVRFITYQYRRFWSGSDWSPNRPTLASLETILQSIFDYNCHALEILCQVPYRLTSRLPVGTIKALLESMLPYLVLYNADHQEAGHMLNLPIELSCFESPYSSLITGGLTYLPPSQLIVAILQFLRDFLVHTKVPLLSSPGGAEAFHLDMTEYGCLFTPSGYGYELETIEKLYVDTLSGMFGDFLLKLKHWLKEKLTEMATLRWEEILFELYRLFEVLFLEPRKPTHARLTHQVTTLTALLLRRSTQLSHGNTTIWSYFERIDADLAAKSRTRQDDPFVAYLTQRLNSPKGGIKRTSPEETTAQAIHRRLNGQLKADEPTKVQLVNGSVSPGKTEDQATQTGDFVPTQMTMAKWEEQQLTEQSRPIHYRLRQHRYPTREFEAKAGSPSFSKVASAKGCPGAGGRRIPLSPPSPSFTPIRQTLRLPTPRPFPMTRGRKPETPVTTVARNSAFPVNLTCPPSSVQPSAVFYGVPHLDETSGSQAKDNPQQQQKQSDSRVNQVTADLAELKCAALNAKERLLKELEQGVHLRIPSPVNPWTEDVPLQGEEAEKATDPVQAKPPSSESETETVKPEGDVELRMVTFLLSNATLDTEEAEEEDDAVTSSNSSLNGHVKESIARMLEKVMEEVEDSREEGPEKKEVMQPEEEKEQ